MSKPDSKISPESVKKKKVKYTLVGVLILSIFVSSVIGAAVYISANSNPADDKFTTIDGDKIDLEDKREVYVDDVNRILEENNIEPKLKIETSAKEGLKTEEAFTFLVKYLIERYYQTSGHT